MDSVIIYNVNKETLQRSVQSFTTPCVFKCLSRDNMLTSNCWWHFLWFDWVGQSSRCKSRFHTFLFWLVGWLTVFFLTLFANVLLVWHDTQKRRHLTQLLWRWQHSLCLQAENMPTTFSNSWIFAICWGSEHKGFSLQSINKLLELEELCLGEDMPGHTI